jgi:Fur family ferric uptake transcriptional regulator
VRVAQNEKLLHNATMETNEVIRLLQGRGHRMTAARRFMIAALCEALSPLAATDLLKDLDKHKLHSNKTTVYRELNFLAEQNIARSVDFGDSTKRYEIASDHHHHHLICTKCGKVEDVELERDVEEEGVRLGKEKEFTVTSHSLEFFGKCKACQK